jgi:hypothetical protein
MLNLNNEVFGFYLGNERYPIQREYYSRTVSVGLRWTPFGKEPQLKVLSEGDEAPKTVTMALKSRRPIQLASHIPNPPARKDSAGVLRVDSEGRFRGYIQGGQKLNLERRGWIGTAEHKSEHNNCRMRASQPN